MFAPPRFGPGTVEIELMLGEGLDQHSLEVWLDNVAIGDRFARVETGVRAVIEIGEGEHVLRAQARGADDRDGEVTARLLLEPPPALPPLSASRPRQGAKEVPLASWVALRFGEPIPTDAVSSGLSRCLTKVSDRNEESAEILE